MGVWENLGKSEMQVQRTRLISLVSSGDLHVISSQSGYYLCLYELAELEKRHKLPTRGFASVQGLAHVSSVEDPNQNSSRRFGGTRTRHQSVLEKCQTGFPTLRCRMQR